MAVGKAGCGQGHVDEPTSHAALIKSLLRVKLKDTCAVGAEIVRSANAILWRLPFSAIGVSQVARRTQRLQALGTIRSLL